MRTPAGLVIFASVATKVGLVIEVCAIMSTGRWQAQQFDRRCLTTWLVYAAHEA